MKMNSSTAQFTQGAQAGVNRPPTTAERLAARARGTSPLPRPDVPVVPAVARSRPSSGGATARTAAAPAAVRARSPSAEVKPVRAISPVVLRATTDAEKENAIYLTEAKKTLAEIYGFARANGTTKIPKSIVLWELMDFFKVAGTKYEGLHDIFENLTYDIAKNAKFTDGADPETKFYQMAESMTLKTPAATYPDRLQANVDLLLEARDKYMEILTSKINDRAFFLPGEVINGGNDVRNPNLVIDSFSDYAHAKFAGKLGESKKIAFVAKAGGLERMLTYIKQTVDKGVLNATPDKLSRANFLLEYLPIIGRGITKSLARTIVAAIQAPYRAEIPANNIAGFAVVYQIGDAEVAGVMTTNYLTTTNTESKSAKKMATYVEFSSSSIELMKVFCDVVPAAGAPAPSPLALAVAVASNLADKGTTASERITKKAEKKGSKAAGAPAAKSG